MNKLYVFIKPVIVSVLVMVPLFALSQNAAIDSLNALLPTIEEDTNKANTLIQLAYEYRDIEAQKTIDLSVLARDLSERLDYVKGRAQAIRNIGLGYHKTGNYDTAISICQQAIEICENHGLLRIKADALNTVGNTYFYQGKLNEAITVYKEILDTYDTLGRNIDRAGTLSNMGNIYSNQGNYAQALENFQQALKIFEDEDHVTGMANVQHNIADLYEKQLDYDMALTYYLKTAKNDSISGNKAGRANTLSNIAKLHMSLGDTSKAVSSYYQSMRLFREAGSGCRINLPRINLGDLYLSTGELDSAYKYVHGAYQSAQECQSQHMIIRSQINLGRYYAKVNDMSNAKLHLQSGFDLAQKNGLKPIIARSAEHLYQFKRETGKYKEALELLELKSKIDKELFNEDNTRQLTRLESEYKFEKEKQNMEHDQQLQILKYNEELETQRIIQWGVIIGLIVMSILALLVGRLYLNKRKVNDKLALTNEEVLEQNMEIQAQNEEITQQRDQLEERSTVVENQQIELQKKNDELVVINQEKNALIAIVAHDLKSPINQIRGIINVAKTLEENVTDQMKEYFDVMEASSNRSVEMIDRILDINAIENRKLDVEIGGVDLHRVVDLAYQNATILAKEKNIELHDSTVNCGLQVYADKNLLLEVLENLLSNAIKFSPKGKNVYIELEEHEPKIHLKVRDEGPGIGEEDQKILFKKYQKLTAQPTAGEKSTGLGLAIVKRYVEEMEGKVWCESKVGQGATFIVSLKKLT